MAIFYRRWIIANGLAELVGLGLCGVIGYLLLNSAPAWLIFLGMITLGIALEGVLVGWLQWRVLHTQLADLSRREWMVATAIGAGVAWTLGMLPSTLMDMSVSAETTITEPSPLLINLLAAALGLALGPILAFAQWWVLRKHIQRAGWWIPANALAWALGMSIIFSVVGIVSDGMVSLGTAVAVLVTGLTLAGMVVGAVHGYFLVRLLSPTNTLAI